MKTTTELCRQKYTDVYRQVEVVTIRREYTSGDWGGGASTFWGGNSAQGQCGQFQSSRHEGKKLNDTYINTLSTSARLQPCFIMPARKTRPSPVPVVTDPDPHTSSSRCPLSLSLTLR